MALACKSFAKFAKLNLFLESAWHSTSDQIRGTILFVKSVHRGSAYYLLYWRRCIFTRLHYLDTDYGQGTDQHSPTPPARCCCSVRPAGSPTFCCTANSCRRICRLNVVCVAKCDQIIDVFCTGNNKVTMKLDVNRYLVNLTKWTSMISRNLDNCHFAFVATQLFSSGEMSKRSSRLCSILKRWNWLICRRTVRNITSAVNDVINVKPC